MRELDQSYNITSNAMPMNQDNLFIRLRLETTPIIENIEMFLRGAQTIITEDEHGNVRAEKVIRGVQKANDEGIQAILSWIQLILNPHVILGNFPSDSKNHSTMYENYVIQVRLDFTDAVLKNCYRWGIADEDIDMIIDSFMNTVEAVMTRLIDNQERTTLIPTVHHTETNTVREEAPERKSRFFGI